MDEEDDFATDTVLSDTDTAVDLENMGPDDPTVNPLSGVGYSTSQLAAVGLNANGTSTDAAGNVYNPDGTLASTGATGGGTGTSPNANFLQGLLTGASQLARSLNGSPQAAAASSPQAAAASQSKTMLWVLLIGGAVLLVVVLMEGQKGKK